MTQYRTNNPLGSMAPRDLFDNAQNVDNWSNGEEPFYEDRFGVMRRSFSGMNFEFEAAQEGRNAEFDAQMAALGYISKGAYAGGVVLRRYNEYVTVPGIISGGTPAFYRPGPNAELPLTLEGDWAIDGPLLLQMDNDDVLRQDLENGTASVNPDSVTGLNDSLTELNQAVAGVDEKFNDIYLLHPQQNSTAVVTVYCDPVTGDDENPGTLEAPYKTFQRAVDGCPRILTHQYVIDLKSSPAARGGLPVTYDEDIVIRDIHAPMTSRDTPRLIGSGLKVLGSGPTVGTHDPADVKLGSLTVAGCTGIANPEIYGFTATRISPFYEQEEYVAVYGTQEAQFYNLAFANTDGTKAGVRPYGSGVVVKGIDVTGLRHGVWAKRGAYAVMQTVYGVRSTGSTYRSDEGSLVTRVGPDTVTGRSDPRDLMTSSYGLLHSQNGMDFLRGMYYGSLELETTLGQDALALGYRVIASGTDSVAVGRQARATGLGGVALGVSAVADFDNCTALGRAATVTAANQVQLGNSSTSTYVYGTVQNRSDARDKADIEDTNLGIDFVMGLRPVSARWDYRDDYRVTQEDGTVLQLERDGSKKRTRRHQFFIAQEVAELCEKMGVEFAGLQHHAVSGGEDVFSLGYDEFIPPLAKAVQQCWSRLDEIERRLKRLEG